MTYQLSLTILAIYVKYYDTCYVTVCYVMLCYVELRYAMLCCVTLLCYVVLGCIRHVRQDSLKRSFHDGMSAVVTGAWNSIVLELLYYVDL